MEGFFIRSGSASVGAPSGAIKYGAPLILIAAEAAPTASDTKSYLKWFHPDKAYVALSKGSVVGWVEPAKPNNTNFNMI